MRDVLKRIYPWVVFAGSVLIVAVLYWAQVFLVPVALAVLLSFVLTPVVTPLQRWFGRFRPCGAGAVYVSSTLLEAREQLYQLLPMLSPQPRPV